MKDLATPEVAANLQELWVEQSPDTDHQATVKNF